MTGKIKFAALLLALGLGVVLYLFLPFSRSGSKGGRTQDKDSSEVVSFSEIEPEPQASLTEAVDLERKVVHSPRPAHLTGLVSVQLFNDSGTLINVGKVKWVPDLGREGAGDYLGPNGVGEFSIDTKEIAGVLVATAEGYWVKTIRLGAAPPARIDIVLDTIKSYRKITCVDVGTMTPQGGIRVASLRDSSDWEGEVISDARGIVKIPEYPDQILRVQVAESNEHPFAGAIYELYPEDEYLPLYRKCVANIFVRREQGENITGAVVGVESTMETFGKKNASTVGFVGTEEITDSKGEAELHLAFGVEQLVWAKQERVGYFSKTILPKSKYLDVAFSIVDQESLLLQVVSPTGASEESVLVTVERNGEIERVERGEGGHYEIFTPALISRIHISSPQCQSVEGLLSTRGLEANGVLPGIGGFVKVQLEKGYSISGIALRLDRTPAQAKVSLVPIGNRPNSAVILEKEGASKWRWSQTNELLKIPTDENGGFRFEGVPRGRYFLDEILSNGIPASEQAVCTYFSEDTVLDISSSLSHLEVILPTLTNLKVTARDVSNGKDLPRFYLLRDIQEGGVLGLPGKGKNGHFIGWLPIEESHHISIEAKGFVPGRLSDFIVFGPKDEPQAICYLEPLIPGSITISPNGGSDAIPIRVVDLGGKGISDENSPPIWGKTIQIIPGEFIDLPVPTSSETTIAFEIIDSEIANSFNVFPKTAPYFPGQSITLVLEGNPNKVEHKQF